MRSTSLPPTLHSLEPNARPSCSKAPRGLFVLAYLGRVFTAISISPSLSPRQFSSRSAFRAGRNLPDKEFRYHRTVIVTAAVHTGLSSKLIPICIGFHPKLLTFVHWAGVSPYTLPFGFAETCVLVKQSVSVFCCGPDKSGQGISHRLRPAILPSSLEIVISIALVFSTSPPVSVCGTETLRFVPINRDPVRFFLDTETCGIVRSLSTLNSPSSLDLSR